MLVNIVGIGRNGSTLLARLLDGSPGLWVYPIELNYLRIFAPETLRARMRQWFGRVILGDKLEEFWVWNRFRMWSKSQLEELHETYLKQLEQPLHPRGNVLQIANEEENPSLHRSMVLFLQAVQRVYDQRIISSKPLLTFKSTDVENLTRYCDVFPNMLFVHIVRHPLSNYASLKRTNMIRKQKPFWYLGGDILRAQLEDRWIPHVQFILEKTRCHPDQHLMVRYEDLCEKPMKIVNEICNWLDVPAPEEPNLQTVLGGKHMKELPINPSQKGVKTPEKVISNMAELFNYKEVVTPREKAFIFFRTGELCHQLGYPVEDFGKSLLDRLRLAKDWFFIDEWERINIDSTMKWLRAILRRRKYIYSSLGSKDQDNVKGNETIDTEPIS